MSRPTSRRTRTLRRRPTLLPLALAALAACAGPSGDAADAAEGAEESSVRILPYPLEKPDFTFTDVDGNPFDFRSDTEGFVTLLFFGYTNCPDICPVQMANIGAVLRDLPAETARRIKVVFVTTDPDRDTPERLRAWLGALHPGFVGLRGPLEEVHAAEAALLLPQSMIDTTHAAGAHGEDPEYTVGHASPVVAFGAGGLAQRMYLPGTRQQDWRRDLPLFVQAADAPPGE